jgi:hypothetical protein
MDKMPCSLVYVATFQRNLLPPSSRQRQQIPSEYWYLDLTGWMLSIEPLHCDCDLMCTPFLQLAMQKSHISNEIPQSAECLVLG